MDLAEELAAVVRRVDALEAAKGTDARNIDALRVGIRELEVRMEGISISVKSLSNSMETSNLTWRRDLTELTAKIAVLEERARVQAEAQVSLGATVDGMKEQMIEGFARLGEKVDNATSKSSEEIRAALPTPIDVPWYKDLNKLKEIGTAVALIWMTISSIVMSTNPPKPPAPSPAPHVDSKPAQ